MAFVKGFSHGTPARDIWDDGRRPHSRMALLDGGYWETEEHGREGGFDWGWGVRIVLRLFRGVRRRPWGRASNWTGPDEYADASPDGDASADEHSGADKHVSTHTDAYSYRYARPYVNARSDRHT